MSKHALRRTSPKGEPFVGSCYNCLKSGLTWEDFFKEECENPAGRAESDDLMIAIKDELQ